MDSFSQARQRKQVLTVSSNASSNTSSDNDGSLSDLASSSSSLSVSPSSASASSKNPLLTGSTSTDSSARRGKEKRNGSILLPFDEIPEWQQDNEYIRHGYRPESGSMRACFASWLYLHNETINIFSHLVPAIFFLGAEVWIFSFFKAGYPQAKPLERFVFAFFLLSAFVCLGLSACYHTMLSHSAKVSELWLRLDFIGIVCLTLGDFVSGIYMMFYCEPTLQKVYWTMVR
jgi:adiponectin receptor